jgi:hypothetical protein
VRLTGQTGQSKAEAATMFYEMVCMHSSRRSCIGSGVACMCAGKLCVVFELWFDGLCSLLEHGFCLGCVESLPFPKGSETCLLLVILLCLFIGFRSSLLLVVSFPFLLSLVIKSCVLSMHSSRGD